MLGYGEMDDNNAATYTMQGINYNDARKPFLQLRDICRADALNCAALQKF